MITATPAELNKMQLAIFYEFCQEHPDVAQTAANGRALRSYLEEHGLSISWKSLSTAYNTLKASGQLELKKRQAELQEEQYERVRQVIYAEVNAKLAPGRIDFTNPSIRNKIAAYLHAKERGLMSVDRVLRAIEAHKFDPGFWQVEPADLFKPQDYVNGRFNHSKKKVAEDNSPTEFGNRRNHARDIRNRESEEETKRAKKMLEDDESRVIGEMWTQAIDGYRAVVNGRIHWSKTEIIQNLLRKTKANPIELLRTMPDDPDTAAAWLRRRV